MPFSTDRDLLSLEPRLFHDVTAAALLRIHVHDGVVGGGTALSSGSADFIAASVDAGAVALVAGTPAEVIARTGATTLTVSRLRPATDDPPIALPGGSGLEVVVRSFAAQAALVHDQLLRMIGLDPDEVSPAIPESAVMSRGLLRRIEAQGALARIFAGAAAVAPASSDDNAELWAKADHYHRRFRSACLGARVQFDLDGDGKPDFARDLSVMPLIRG